MLVGEIGWAYIAGFFDGEGCVKVRPEYSHGHGYGTPMISISQTRDRGKLLLDEIQEFLLGHNILSKVRSYTPRNLEHQQAWTLWIHSRPGVCLFIQRVLPYVKIKKVEAQDVLRYSKLYKMPRHGASHSMLIKEAWGRRKSASR